MNKSSKVWYGILSILPLIFFIAYFITFISFFFTLINQSSSSTVQPLPTAFLPMFVVLFLAVITMLINIVIFLIHAINNKTVTDNERLIWIIMFIFLGFVAFPVYWYMRIYKTSTATSSSLTSLSNT